MLHQVKKPEVADILYSTADSKLTLDAQTNGVNNTPIAICVIPEVMENFKNGDNSAGAVKTVRFVSINYMNCTTPVTGNKDTQYIYFGDYKDIVGNVKGGTEIKSYRGGKWNTQWCLSKVTKQEFICDGVTNSADTGYCPAVCCCVAYSTTGTKSGDWYLPMFGELYQIYANKAAIDEKRTTLVGSGFIERDRYWSSREYYPSYYECCIYFDSGDFYGEYKHKKCVALAFLALEY